MKEARQKIYEELERLFERFPDMRLGQLISNLSTISRGLPDDVYNVEDEALLQEAREMLQRIEDGRTFNAALSVVAKAS